MSVFYLWMYDYIIRHDLFVQLFNDIIVTYVYSDIKILNTYLKMKNISTNIKEYVKQVIHSLR